MPNPFYKLTDAQKLHAIFHMLAWSVPRLWQCLFSLALAFFAVGIGAAESLPKNQSWGLPTGITPNYSAQVLPNVESYSVSGQGCGNYQTDKRFVGPGSVLLRVGPDSSPVVVIPGADAYLHDFTINGGSTNPTAGILLKFTRGVGTGNMIAERLTIERVRAAWQAGELQADGKCDTSVFRDSNVHHCECVFEQNNAMGMMNRVEGITASHIDCFARINAGGNFRIANSSITKIEDGKICPLLYLGSKGIGSNNNSFSVENVKLDAQCGSRVRLLEMSAPGFVNITYRNVHVANDTYSQDGNLLWLIHDGAVIDIRGCKNVLQKHSIKVIDTPGLEPPSFVIEATHAGAIQEISEALHPESGPVYVDSESVFGLRVEAKGKRVFGVRLKNVHELIRPEKAQ